ncbi:MAG: hypothetical protein AB2L12_05605 [Smithellaceae bacterium]
MVYRARLWDKIIAGFILTVSGNINTLLTMKICHHCKKEIKLNSFTGRQEQCPFCDADLHCCLNCTFYERGLYNDCRERQAERVLDKTRSNFCDFFRFGQTSEKTTEKPSAQDTLEALFRK